MLAPEFGQEEIHIATAQEAMEDACSNARLLNYMDITLTTYDSDWVPSGYRVETRASRTAYAEQTFIDDALESETVRIKRELNGALARSSENTSALIEITEYHRPAGGQWEMSQFTEEEADSEPAFCGWSTENFQTLTRVGTENLSGTTTTKYEATRAPPGEQWDATWEFWVSDAGQLTQMVFHTRDSKAKLVYFDFNEVNQIRPPVGPSPSPSPTATPTPSPSHTPPATATPTPLATATPTPPATATPSPGTRDVWLEPDPSGITFDGQWREFTVRAVGMNDLNFAINVINYPDGPNSTGAIERSSRTNPPLASDECEETYYTGYTVRADTAFNLVGCEAGTVSIEIKDRENGHALLRRYSVTVSGGP